MNVRLRKPKIHSVQGVTLIELLVFMVMIASVCAAGKFAQDNFESRLAWLFGGFAGLILFFLGFFFLAALLDLAFGGGLPNCRDGSCRGPGKFRGHGDYELRKFGEEYDPVCRHGVHYKRRGKRFVIINEDGTETPYLIWRPFRGWFPDVPAK